MKLNQMHAEFVMDQVFQLENVIVKEENSIVQVFVVVQLVQMSVVYAADLVCHQELVTVMETLKIVTESAEVLLPLMFAESVTDQVSLPTNVIVNITLSIA